MHYVFYPKNVCSTRIDVDVEDQTIHNLKYTNGCDGNLQAVAALLEGMDVKEAVNKLSGIRCGGGPTSCADQLARALRGQFL